MIYSKYIFKGIQDTERAKCEIWFQALQFKYKYDLQNITARKYLFYFLIE